MLVLSTSVKIPNRRILESTISQASPPGDQDVEVKSLGAECPAAGKNLEVEARKN